MRIAPASIDTMEESILPPQIQLKEAQGTYGAHEEKPLEPPSDKIQTKEAEGSQSPHEDASQDITTPPSSLDKIVDSDDVDKPASETTSRRAEKKFIIVRRRYTSFMLPWKLCTTLPSLKESLKALFPTDEEIKKIIDDETFRLVTEDEDTILPAFWESVCQPGWTVRLVMDGLTGPDDDASESGDEEVEEETDETDAGGQYITKVQFTTRYYQKERFGDDLELLHEDSQDTPPDLVGVQKTSRQAVIQEVQSIVQPRPSDSSRRMPKYDEQKAGKMVAGSYMKPAKIYIHSQLLLNALRAIVTYSSILPGDTEQSLQEGSFRYPYPDLFHHKNELLAFKEGKYPCRANHDEVEQKQCDEHIDLLLSYLYDQTSVRLAEVEVNWKKPKPTTSFAAFWLLMKPGETVYIRNDADELDAYVLDRIYGGVSYSHVNVSTASPYSLHVWYLDFDGRVIKRYQRTFSVPIFDHEQDILSLPVIPASFQDKADGGKVREKLINRGKKFFMCSRKPTFMEYTGRGVKAGWKKVSSIRSLMTADLTLRIVQSVTCRY